MSVSSLPADRKFPRGGLKGKEATPLRVLRPSESPLEAGMRTPTSFRFQGSVPEDLHRPSGREVGVTGVYGVGEGVRGLCVWHM